MIQSTFVLLLGAIARIAVAGDSPRERISLNENWRFTRGDPTNLTASLLYDVRPELPIRRAAEAGADGNPAANESARPKDSTNSTPAWLKAWILPTGNDFIKDATRKFVRPEGNPGEGVLAKSSPPTTAIPPASNPFKPTNAELSTDYAW